MVGAWEPNPSGSGQEPMADFCKHCNKPPGSTKGRNFDKEICQICFVFNLM